MPDGGEAVFARQYIPPGTLVLCEKSWIDLEVDESWWYLPLKFLKLDKDRQKQYLSLPHHSILNVSKREEYLKQFGPNPVNAAVRSILSFEMQVRILSIYAKHAMRNGNNGVVAMFPILRKLRHTCTPNATLCWSTDVNSILIHTIKPVHKGHELAYSFVTFWESLEKRASNLQAYGVTCACHLCVGASNAQEKRSRRRRQHIFDLYGSLQSQWDIHRWPERGFPDHYADDRKPGKQLVALSKSLYKAVLKEELRDVTLIDWQMQSDA